MNKVLVCCSDEKALTKLQRIIGNHREMILTDTLEQANEVLKLSKIDILFSDQTDKFSNKAYPSLKIIPIPKSIKDEEVLKFLKH